MTLIEVIAGTLITISISLSGWTIKEVVELRSTVARIEANHFSTGDGLQVWKEIAAIKEIVVRDSERINSLPNQGPPLWFADQVRSMESRISLRMDKIEAKIDSIPAKR